MRAWHLSGPRRRTSLSSLNSKSASGKPTCAPKSPLLEKNTQYMSGASVDRIASNVPVFQASLPASCARRAPPLCLHHTFVTDSKSSESPSWRGLATSLVEYNTHTVMNRLHIYIYSILMHILLHYCHVTGTNIASEKLSIA